MLLSAIGVFVVVMQHDVVVFCLGGLFRRRGFSSFATLLLLVKCWSPSVSASSNGVFVVGPWCGQRNVGVFCLAGLFFRRNYAALETPLPSVKCLSSFIFVSDPPSIREACWCVDYGCWISLCLPLL